MSEWKRPQGSRRVRTPFVLQMEATECGAASLGIVLGYHGMHVSLERLRQECGVSRDGSKASNVVRAAERFGLVAKGFSRDIDQLYDLPLPAILFWQFRHFLVLEGWDGKRFYVNDPAQGRRAVSFEEFDAAYTGVVLIFEPGPGFQASGERPGLGPALARRLRGLGTAMLLLALAALLGVLPGLAIPTLGKVFVDEVLGAGNTSWSAPLALGFLLMAVLQAASAWLSSDVLRRVEQRVSTGASAGFLWHVLRLPLPFFAQRYAGDLVQRVQINDFVAGMLAGRAATVLTGAASALFLVAAMVWYDPLLAVVALLLYGVSGAVVSLGARRLAESNAHVLAEEATLAGMGASGITNIETLKANGMESDFFAHWAGVMARARQARNLTGSLTQRFMAMPPAMGAAASAVILCLGGWRVMQGDMSAGTLVAFLALALAVAGPISQMVNMAGDLEILKGSLDRLDDVLQHPVAPEANAFTEEARRSYWDEHPKLHGSVELEGVSFGYSPLEPPLLRDFNLSIPPGCRVALVGASGSGKTTVARLLAGLYQPWHGRITFDGLERFEIPREVLRNSVAMVDQDIFLFEGTVRENITLWNPGTPDESVVAAARDAAIHDLILSRPGGYDAPVTEGGRNFSGGERQRLELARALSVNPSVLILDEATSALDPATEAAIDNHLRRRGATCILVAHRLSTIRDCDEILVLERGAIAERGTHAELMARQGAYARLIAAETPLGREASA